jgi:hypothetical protein
MVKTFIMNNRIKILTLFSFLIFLSSMKSISQVSSWRSQGSSGFSQPRPSSPQPRVSQQPQRDYRESQRDVSSWRYQNPRNNRPIYYYDGPYFGWGWNRWNNWGAPMYNWNYWTPYNYYDDWGYRQPGRIYIMDNGGRDTVYGKRPILGFGLQSSTNNQIGAFFRAGNKSYFIAEFNSRFEKDNSTFFPDGRLQNVDFPLVNDLVKLNSFYLGAGKKFNRFGLHLMVGSIKEVVRYRGKDDIGYITFPKYQDNYLGVKVGGLYDLKNLTIKCDVDPVNLNVTLGLGVNL